MYDNFNKKRTKLPESKRLSFRYRSSLVAALNSYSLFKIKKNTRLVKNNQPSFQIEINNNF